MNDSMLRTFERIIGPDHVDRTVDPPVFYPADESGMRSLIRAAHAEQAKIHLRGGNTFPLPPPAAGMVNVSTGSLTSIKEINPGDYLMRLQTGVTVDSAVDSSESAGLYFPLDITSGDRSTVGGAYMTGALGPGAAGYGPFSHFVTGVRCITAQGESVSFGGRTVKNVTGYDVTRFLAGTMGLFALAVELTVKLLPLPEARLTVSADFGPGSPVGDAVGATLSRIRRARYIELVAGQGLAGPVRLTIGFEGMETLVNTHLETACAFFAEYGGQSGQPIARKIYFKERRLAAHMIAVPGMATFRVPPASSGEFLKRIGVVSPGSPLVAHTLIGRFHLIVPDRAAVDRLTSVSLTLGGKRPVLWERLGTEGIVGLLTPGERLAAQALKRELDPSGLLNPHIAFTG